MLAGKVAVITGGSRGIGREIALTLAKNGANIAILYSGNEEAAQAVCKEAQLLCVEAFSYRCHVENFLEVQATCAAILSQFGQVDILVNNAGITKDNLLLRMSEEDFDQVLSVNLKGAFHLCKHFSKFIMRSSQGRIINISSVSGLMGNSGQVNYAAAKAGLIGLTKSIAKEFASRNVTCNAIAPGFIETDMTQVLPDAVKQSILQSIPLKHMGSPKDIAALALFLASPAGGYITGEVIRVDGGLCM